MKQELFPPDIQEFIALLDKHSVRYLLIGGSAVIYHGYARLTGDFDFFYEREAGNVTRLWAALREFWKGPVPALDGPEELLEPDLIVQFGRPPNRIDLIGTLGSIGFQEAWARRVEDSIGSVRVRILALEDLRVAKREAGRPKDLDDLEHLPGSP